MGRSVVITGVTGADRHRLNRALSELGFVEETAGSDVPSENLPPIDEEPALRYAPAAGHAGAFSGSIDLTPAEARIALLERDSIEAERNVEFLRRTLRAREAADELLRGSARWWRTVTTALTLPLTGRASASRSGDLSVMLARSSLLARSWYCHHHAAAIAADGGNGDALAHFLKHGIRAGLSPNPFFDPEWYLRTYPDVAASGLSAIEHYLVTGSRQALAPGPLFDPIAYNVRYPDLGREPDLLAHYLRKGIHQGRIVTPVRIPYA